LQGGQLGGGDVVQHYERLGGAVPQQAAGVFDARAWAWQSSTNTNNAINQRGWEDGRQVAVLFQVPFHSRLQASSMPVRGPGKVDCEAAGGSALLSVTLWQGQPPVYPRNVLAGSGI
jgi:hypothetical protein